MLRTLMLTVVVTVTASGAAAHGQARLALGPVFQDHAVLQRDRPITGWGAAGANEQVTVALADHQATARADASGRWSAALPAMGAGGAGQCLVGWDGHRALDRRSRRASGRGAEPTYRLPAGALRAGDNVLVVNVLSTWDAGGMIGPADKVALTFDDGTSVPLAGNWRYRTVPLAMGRPPWAPWETIAGLTTLYNGMIAPLGPYGLRGVVWYQGETNADEPAGYQKLLAGLMAGWRAQFGANLPFLVVELPGFGPAPTAPAEANWADIREAQRRAVAADAHAGLAVTIDLGERNDLHPINKQEAGSRLARAARHVAYDEQHSNAYAAWLRMGSPQQPTPAQFAELEQASALQELEPARAVTVGRDGTVTAAFDLPRTSVSFVKVMW